MDVTAMTWVVAVGGLALILLLGVLQAVAVARPTSEWTIKNVYGGTPDGTDRTAYLAYNQGFAWADVAMFVPLQIAASLGMLFGQRWGFLLALAASVPFVYTAIQFFVWDRALGFRESTVYYWVIVWGMWPAFGLLEGVYCFVRLLETGGSSA